MATNIEIKAKCDNPDFVEELVKKIATKFIGIDNQTDTYFQTKTGRFKLRESSIDGNYLIPYLRPDQFKSKKSIYDRIPVANTEKIKTLFGDILGLHCVVKKIRKIYLYENVRIHIDEVDQLGAFIELEAVYDETKDSEENQRQKIEYLRDQFSITDEMLIDISYENMISII